MTWKKQPSSPTSGKGGNPACPTVATCPYALKPSMSEAQAQAFMDQFKKSDIPFDYPVDCCYARARAMCDEMAKQGYDSQKLWSEGRLTAEKANGTPVTFPDENGNSKVVNWHYHVAPIVNVTQPDGSVSPRILDPSLSDKPLTVDEWKALCGVKPGDTIDRITPANQGYPFDSRTAGRDYPVSAANRQLQDHRSSRDMNLAAAKGKGSSK